MLYPSGSLHRLEPGIALAASGANTAGGQARAAGLPSQPEPARAGGSERDKQRIQADVGGKEINQVNSRVGPDVGNIVGNVPGSEVERTYSPPSTLLTLPTEGPDGG